MLNFERHLPPNARDGAPLIVLLHGRGSDRHDLLGLAPHLPGDAVVVTPEAPFPAAPWGYGPGSAWYRFLERNRPEPESFEGSQQALHSFLQELPGQLPLVPGPMVLGGFSQGATMSLGYALRRPGSVPLVLHFSGFLADHPSVSATPETVAGTKIFWGHGTRDPAIPFALAVEGRAALQQAGGDLTARDYAIGHWIDGVELADAIRWLEDGLAGHEARDEARLTRGS